MQHGRFLSGFWRLWPPDHPISEQIDSGEGGAWREKKGRGTGRVPYARPRCAGARLWRPVEPARAPQPFSRSATGSDTDSTKRCHEEKRRRSASLAARGAPEATTGDRGASQRLPERPRAIRAATPSARSRIFPTRPATARFPAIGLDRRAGARRRLLDRRASQTI